jgi:hypothetical protein
LLAAAVKTFLSDMERAKAIGRRGYERLHSHFSMQQNLDKTMQVYSQLLDHGGAERSVQVQRA